MKTVFLTDGKPFYKANLHCHSTNSDGKLTPEKIKEAYKTRGYSVVAFTDHEHLIDNSALNDAEFLTITGCEMAIKEFPELSTLKKHDMKVCHLNFYARDPHNTLTPCYSTLADHFWHHKIKDLIRHEGEYDRVYSATGINDMIARANAAGFLVSYNHPRWSLENALQYLQYEGLFAVEIYNHSCTVYGGDEYAIDVFDDFLRAGKKIFCTACDDNHNKSGLTLPYGDSFGGWVMVNADRLDYESVITSLEKGDFYVYQGPEIRELYALDGKLMVETSPAKRIAYTTQGRRGKAVNAGEGETVTHGEFTIDPTDGYFRIDVVDELGRHADSQAYEVKELI